jgi:hypothetical protein
MEKEMQRKEDGSDDPEFQDWKRLQTKTMSWMLAVPSGKLGYDLYKGGMLKSRECALQRMLQEEEKKEMATKKDVYEHLFDDLDE